MIEIEVDKRKISAVMYGMIVEKDKNRKKLLSKRSNGGKNER